ncbi:MAG: ArsR family transcriptional regulator [Candidatus Zixiibacteriota bacterium]|nr:MAG: ArsR family transcriptional regulator [candidate division Zixibacteria bacterium]
MFKALADETRQQILRFLKDGPLNVGEIVERTTLSQPTISHHLGILKRAGVVVTQRRGKQIYYALCCGPERLECCSPLFRLFGISLTPSTTRKEDE